MKRERGKMEALDLIAFPPVLSPDTVHCIISLEYKAHDSQF